MTLTALGLKPDAQTVDAKPDDRAPTMGAFFSTVFEPMPKKELFSAVGVSPLKQVIGAPEHTTQPVAPVVQSLQKSGGASDAFAAIMGGGGMPPIPPLNLNMTTSSDAKTGAQTSSGGFVSHGINFGTQQSGPNWLVLGALALGVLWLMKK